MKTILTLFFTLLLSLPLLNAQTNCNISDFQVIDVSSCTYNTYVVIGEIQVQDPGSRGYKFAYKALPNGNWVFSGDLSYSNTTFSLGTIRKDLSYALFIFDQEDMTCSLRDTIHPMTCQAPCRVDSLSVKNVRCYAGSDKLELRFEFPTFQFGGGFLYDAYPYGDTTRIGQLWMAPWGTLLIDRQYEKDSITLCQVGADSACCRNFYIPECMDHICPIGWVDHARADTCIGGLVGYEFQVEHDPALDLYYTEFQVFDENRRLVIIDFLRRGQTKAFFTVPESPDDRVFTVCDVYGMCCFDLLVPGARCDSLVSSLRNYRINGLSVFPNPVRDQLTVVWGGNEPGFDELQYNIVNAMGQTLVSGILSTRERSLDVSALRSGTYYLQLITGNGQVDCRPFVRIE